MKNQSTLLEPFEDLVENIHCVNRLWKLYQELDEFGKDHACTLNYRDLKSCLQVRLLRSYPEFVYLALDKENSIEGEPLLSVGLNHPNCSHPDAAHLPVRIAKEVLTPQELQRYFRSEDLLQ
ncbi:hypothetical protein [[Limnothrix rosea] IAM M-220]|uniref:hypothetical protein n=1 Tax=[Limnothrix rosea] IAM M-220 TaxID=454133 RepID=UPI000964CF87|nr:hypothetical protein [[Limnothrix rosea] IAM M-220]OKH11161.1 hypothetical protein NIES208_17730 [[Limnothrix rosea] IAM M-220]